jgi:hypothetical protein
MKSDHNDASYPYLPNATHIISFDFDFDFAPNPRMWLCRHSLIEDNTLPDDLQTLKWAQETVLGDISRSALQHMQSYAEHMGVYDLSFLGTAYMYPLSFPLRCPV